MTLVSFSKDASIFKDLTFNYLTSVGISLTLAAYKEPITGNQFKELSMKMDDG